MTVKKWVNADNFTGRRYVADSFSNYSFRLGNEMKRQYPILIYEIKYQYCSQEWEYIADNHIGSAIEFPLEGYMIIHRNEQTFSVQPGQVFLLHAGTSFHLRTGSSGFCRKVSVSLSGSHHVEQLKFIFGDNFYFPVYSLAALQESLKKIAEQIKLQEKAKLAELSVMSYAFLLELAESIPQPELPQELRIAMTVIDTIKNTRMTADQIARDLNLSGYQLSSLFKEHLNTTVKQYIIKVRMDSAARLLRNTDMKIKDISIASGYSHEVNFISDFSKYFGMPPLRYRIEHLRKNAPDAPTVH